MFDKFVGDAISPTFTAARSIQKDSVDYGVVLKLSLGSRCSLL